MALKHNYQRLRSALLAGVTSAQNSWNSEKLKYAITETGGNLSAELLNAVTQLRGPGRPPAIVIHGVMPRSGTVYCGELVRLHPDIIAYPYDLWEMPLLQATREIEELQQAFLQGYKKNRDKLGENDFLAIVGAAFIGYLYAALPEGKRLLIKVPRAAYLAKFASMFPMEDCLMLMRDGRNLTESTLRTWPRKNFEATVTTWRDATRLMLEVTASNKMARVCKLYRYEDISADPFRFAQDLCESYGLDPHTYPFEEIHPLPARGASNTSDAGKVDWDPKVKPTNSPSSEYWKSWGKKKKASFKELAGAALIESAYVKDDNW